MNELPQGHMNGHLEGHRLAGVCMAIGVLIIALGAVGSAFVSYRAPIAEAPVEKEPSAFDSVVILADAAIVYDLTTGETLYEKNAEAQLPLASLTKLLTIFAAAQALEGNPPITIGDKALAPEGDSGFTLGDTFLFEDLAKLALVASSNDAAEALALAAEARVGGNEASLMASAVSALGLSQTYALNGTGLDESSIISGGYGSARDIALLAGAFLERVPGIARATLQPSVTATSLEGRSYTLKNTNPEVSAIPGLRLSKTGFTDLAGGNLAIVFDAGLNHPIAIVVLGSTRESRFTDVDTLVQATAQEFSGVPLP